MGRRLETSYSINASINASYGKNDVVGGGKHKKGPHLRLDMKRQPDGGLKASNPRVNLDWGNEQCYPDIGKCGGRDKKVLMALTWAMNQFLDNFEETEKQTVHRMTKGPYHDACGHHTHCTSASNSTAITTDWVRGNFPLGPAQSQEASLVADSLATAENVSDTSNPDESRKIGRQQETLSIANAANPSRAAAVAVEEIGEASRLADAAPAPAIANAPDPQTLERIRTHVKDKLLPELTKNQSEGRTSGRRLNKWQKRALSHLDACVGNPDINASCLKTSIGDLIDVYVTAFQKKQEEQYWHGVRKQLEECLLAWNA